MMESRASRAPMSPPETGASIAAIPRAAAALAISTARAGSLVVMSTRTEPAAAPASVPSAPSVIARTSEGWPTIEKTTSAAAATAFGEDAGIAPRAVRGANFAAVRL